MDRRLNNFEFSMNTAMDTPNKETKEVYLIRYPGDDIGTALLPKCVVYKRKKEESYSWNEYDTNLRSNPPNLTLVVNNQNIYVNANILASKSDYFYKMFTSSFKEQNQDKIEINIMDVSYESLNELITFFYTSSLTISERNVQDLLIGSDVFLLDDVREVCVKYLKSMIDIENCINMKDFASRLDLNDLYELCLTYMVNNFSFIADSPEFLTLTYDEIMLLIKNEDLNAKENKVYDAVIKWIKHDFGSRAQHMSELLWFVRIPLVYNNPSDVAQDIQSAEINGQGSFRMEHRKPFRKGILLVSHFSNNSPPEWFDAETDSWKSCLCNQCPFKNINDVFSLKRYQGASCYLLHDGCGLLTLGGFGIHSGMRQATVFDSMTKKWDPLPDMNFGRVRPYIVQIGSKIFAVGGFTHDVNVWRIPMIEFYDLIKKKWYAIREPKIGISRSQIDICVTCINELIFIIGPEGCGNYNTIKNKWNPIAQIPSIGEGAAICALNNSIYVIGGSNTKSVWAYCLETKMWVTIAEMNCPRSYSGAVVMNGFIYVLGGTTKTSSHLSTYEIYNPHKNEWTLSRNFMNYSHSNIDTIIIQKECVLYKNVFEDENPDANINSREECTLQNNSIH